MSKVLPAAAYTAETALGDVWFQHPDISDDQLLIEAKRVFKDFKGPKAGRGVFKKDLKEFREHFGPAPAKPAEHVEEKDKPSDIANKAISEILENFPDIDDKDLLKRARAYRRLEGDPGNKVTAADVKRYRQIHGYPGGVVVPAPLPAPADEKKSIIEHVYYGKNGFGSIAHTVELANRYIRDNNRRMPPITAADVRAWKNVKVVPKTKPGGYNSFIPDRVGLEVQVDLFFMPSPKPEVEKGVQAKAEPKAKAKAKA